MISRFSPQPIQPSGYAGAADGREQVDGFGIGQEGANQAEFRALRLKPGPLLWHARQIRLEWLRAAGKIAG